MDGGCALAPRAVAAMFPDAGWTFVTANPFNAEECARDRFGENFQIQKKIYAVTDALCRSGRTGHIMIGGDHSVNFGHFAALADNCDDDLRLVYIDAHFDIHTPESGRMEASGAPHGSNIRALLGTGDKRWMTLPQKQPSLRPENLFYLGVRSYEQSEEEFVRDNNIFVRTPEQLATQKDWASAIKEIRARIGGHPFVLSFDFDSLNPEVFRNVLVPASSGITSKAAEFFLREFSDAIAFEFVEYAPSGCEKSAELVKKLIGIIAEDKRRD